MKKILAIALITVMCFTAGCADKGEDNAVKVSVEIICSDILDNYEMLEESLRNEKYVPSNGIILEKTEVTVNEGDGAIEVLEKIAKEKDIQIDITDGYAKGINHVYEKSCGAMSGWIYEVNNESVMTEYFVTEGDVITWKYICDFSAFTE